MDNDSEFTGRQLVLFRPGRFGAAVAAISELTSPKNVIHSSAYSDGAPPTEEINRADIFVLNDLGVAVVRCDDAQLPALRSAAAQDQEILAVEPERRVYALPADDLGPGTALSEYLRGYRDAVNGLYTSLRQAPAEDLAKTGALGALRDDLLSTWGLKATGAHASRYSGKGIRVAVLDTGFDAGHPDFAGRQVISKSFVQAQDAGDLNGHGTHCVGIALGKSQLSEGIMRYGCANQADIYVGKVLGDDGGGCDQDILSGINWAVQNSCRIVSMSLGSRVQPGERYSEVYEAVAQRVLQANPGTLLIAAAGNDSKNSATGARNLPSVPVSRPANCPSILAVGAVDSALQVAPFSNGGINMNGGAVDIVGPGVDILSSAPMKPARQTSANPWPSRYHRLSGTSMATPYVAGIAAMWLEASGAGTSAQALWDQLTTKARPLHIDSRDVGSGLIQAP